MTSALPAQLFWGFIGVWDSKATPQVLALGWLPLLYHGYTTFRTDHYFNGQHAGMKDTPGHSFSTRNANPRAMLAFKLLVEVPGEYVVEVDEEGVLFLEAFPQLRWSLVFAIAKPCLNFFLKHALWNSSQPMRI